MQQLEIEPETAPSVGDLSAVIAQEIPGVTLGLTRGSKRHHFEETIQIDPIFQGLAQLVAVIKAIDEGVCDEED